MSSDIVIGIILSTLLILLLIAGVTISFFMASRERSKQQVVLSETRLNYERELRKVETEVSEYMMQQFARELHDNIGHTLTCMRLAIENNKLDHPGQQGLFAPVETYLDDASQQLRLLSRSLNTDYVSTNGIRNAIQLEIDRLRQLRKFNVSFDYTGSAVSLDLNQQLMTFRIFQEIMQNAIRHSGAANVQVAMNGDHPFQLTIADDGKGFDVSEILKSTKASGVKNILRRSEMAQLHCEIHAEPSHGCRYVLSVRQPDKTDEKV